MDERRYQARLALGANGRVVEAHVCNLVGVDDIYAIHRRCLKNKESSTRRCYARCFRT